MLSFHFFNLLPDETFLMLSLMIVNGTASLVLYETVDLRLGQPSLCLGQTASGAADPTAVSFWDGKDISTVYLDGYAAPVINSQNSPAMSVTALARPVYSSSADFF